MSHKDGRNLNEDMDELATPAQTLTENLLLPPFLVDNEFVDNQNKLRILATLSPR